MNTRGLLMFVMAIWSSVACNAREEPDSDSPTGTSAGSIGVAACDDYLEKHAQCVNQHIPLHERGALLESAASMRASWKQAAGNAATKQALAEGCARALEAAKTVMADYGCSW